MTPIKFAGPLPAAIRTTSEAEEVHRAHVDACLLGKGTPAEIAESLHLVLEHAKSLKRLDEHHAAAKAVAHLTRQVNAGHQFGAARQQIIVRAAAHVRDNTLSSAFVGLALAMAHKQLAAGVPAGEVAVDLSLIVALQVAEVAQTSRPMADRLELAAMSEAPELVHCLRATRWGGSHYVPTYGTKRLALGADLRFDLQLIASIHAIDLDSDFAKQALAVVLGSARQHLLNRCDLADVPKQDLQGQIEATHVSDRLLHYAGATVEETAAMVKRLIQLGHGGYATKLPAFMDVCKSPELIRPMFEQDAMTPGLVHSRIRAWRAMAAPHGAQRAAAMLNCALSASARELLELAQRCDAEAYSGAGPRDMLMQFVLQATMLACPHNMPAASLDHLRSTLLALAEQPSIQRLAASSRTNFDAVVRDQLKHAGPLTSSERSNAIRSAFIESGLSKLSALKEYEFTAPLVGAALARKPERIAEIKDVLLFAKVARKFSIPVELTPELRQYVAMTEAAAKAKAQEKRESKASRLADGDPLAKAARSSLVGTR